MKDPKRPKSLVPCTIEDFLIAVDCADAYVEVFDSIVKDFERLELVGVQLFSEATKALAVKAAQKTHELEHRYRVNTGEKLRKNRRQS